MKPLGIYIHIPFCKGRCHYCDFLSGIYETELAERYVDVLITEIAKVARFAQEHTVDSIYIGGGTPSILSPDFLEKIAKSIFANFTVKNPEITLEVNPESAKHFSDWKTIGVNRISIGIQSLDDGILKRAGRLHTAKDALRTMREARRYFTNISADLILGLSEGQTPHLDFLTLKDDISHLSAYLLKVEDNTRLNTLIQNNSVSIATENDTIRQYEQLTDICGQNGFLRYETSNYSKSGQESRHNLKYWSMEEYLGFGAGSHSYFLGRRYQNRADINAYLQGEHSGNGLEHILRQADKSEERTERIMLALRTVKGLDLRKYQKEYGTDFLSEKGAEIERFSQFLQISGDYISIKPDYFLVQNAIILELL